MPLEKLLARIAEAMEAQTQAIGRQTAAIADLAQAQRELADAVLQEEPEDSPFAHLGQPDDRGSDDSQTDIPATM